MFDRQRAVGIQAGWCGPAAALLAAAALDLRWGERRLVVQGG
jgi:hypothetical protein